MEGGKKERKRWPGCQPKSRWAFVLWVSGSEISWHFFLSGFVNFFCSIKNALANTHVSTTLCLLLYPPPTANIHPWIVSAVVALKCEVSFVTGNPQPSLWGTWLNISSRLNLYSAAECFPKVFSQRVREERASMNERAGDFNAPGLCLREGQAHCPYTHTYSIQMSLHEQLTQTYFRQQEMLTSVSKEATQVYLYPGIEAWNVQKQIWNTATFTFESANIPLPPPTLISVFHFLV